MTHNKADAFPNRMGDRFMSLGQWSIIESEGGGTFLESQRQQQLLRSIASRKGADFGRSGQPQLQFFRLIDPRPQRSDRTGDNAKHEGRLLFRGENQFTA